MKIRFGFNLQDWDMFEGTTPIENVVFSNCSNFVGFNEEIPIISFTLVSLSDNGYSVRVFRSDTYENVTYDQTTIGNLIVGQGGTFGFDANISGTIVDKVISMESRQLLRFNINGRTTIAGYLLASEKDVLDKTITGRTMFDGVFNSAIGLKNLNIDITGFYLNASFNYVYIPLLQRYYYVDSIELISADFTRLHLKEDVLMTWKRAIRGQKAFVSRYENSDKFRLLDIRQPLEDILSVEDITSSASDTPSTSSLVNVTFDYNPSLYSASSYPNVMVVTFSTSVQDTRSGAYVPSPSGSGLPAITPQLNDREWVNFIKPSDLFELTTAYISSDNMATYYASVLWLPFNPTTAFNLVSSSTSAIAIKDKYIGEHGTYENLSSSVPPLPTWHSDISGTINLRGSCPYLIVKDFTLSFDETASQTALREPNAYYEMYLAFVGWVKVDSSKIANKRVLIYYTMDLKTGLSTAYIYNYTDKYVIWSGTCQIGIKLDLATTNIEENVKQKQANDLNMILGLVSSALSIGVGVASENPLAIAGGILTASKTIASNVNANKQIYDRATMTFGTSNGALYSNKEFKIVRVYHKNLLTTTDQMNVYKHIQGLPYNDYVASMSTLTGYVEVGEIHFDPSGYSMFQDEIEEIVQLLQGGVIF